MTANPDGWLTPGQAAVRLGVSTRTVTRYCAAGIIPAERIDGRWLVDPTAVEAVYEPVVAQRRFRRAWSVGSRHRARLGPKHPKVRMQTAREPDG